MTENIAACPDCQEDLLKTKKRYVCHECDFTCLIDDLETQAESWSKVLYSDDSLWHQEVSSEAPYLIAHEYSRLRSLLGEQKFFGLLLQIKDFVEVLLKLYVVLEVRKQDSKELYCELLTKPLSLGDWERIARKIQLNLDKTSPVNRILQFFSKNLIVNWRNEKIGHGALSFDDDPEFIADIEDKMKAIYGLLDKIKSDLSDFDFQLQTSEKLLSLNGDKKENQDLEGYVVCDSTALSPLVLVQNSKIFLFDSFLPRARTSMYVDYPSGSKIKINSLEVNKIFDSIEHTKLSSKLSEQSVDDSYLACEESALKQIDAKSDYIVPQLVVKRLKEKFEACDRGVFLLQMERGTGKTSFSRAIDGLDWGKISFDYTVQRAYYINDTYLSNVEAFIDDVRDTLRCDENGAIAIKGKFPELRSDSSTPAYDFALMLNKYREAHEKHFKYSKLLFVFDGIDELSAVENSIADFIPDSDLLDEGVYILLTSRIDSEITSKTKEILSQVDQSNTLVINKNSDLIKDVFTRYLQQHFKIKGDEALQSDIQTLCDNRIVYLKVLKDLHACEHISFKLETVPSYQEIINFYFEAIGTFYDESSLNSIKRLLMIVSIAEEPLDLYDVAYLINEHAVSFRLLSYLSDLRGFLRIERGQKRNKFLISNRKITELVQSKYGQDISELVQEWLMMLGNMQKFDFSNVGLMYLTANASMLGCKYQINEGDFMGDMDMKILSSLQADDWVKYPDDRSIRTISLALQQAQTCNHLDVYFQILIHTPKAYLAKVISERSGANDGLLDDIIEQRAELFQDDLLAFFRNLSAALFASHQYAYAIDLASFVYEQTQAVKDLVNMISFCKGGGAWDKAEQLIQTVLHEQDLDSQGENKAYLSYVVGRLYIDQIDKFEGAKGLLDKSIAAFSLSSPFHADMVRNSLAMYHLMKGEYQAAFVILENLYQKYMDDDRLTDIMKEAIANNYLIAKVLGQEIVSALNDLEFLNPEIKAYYLNNLAIAEHLFGNSEKASYFLQLAEVISRKANKNYALAAVLNNKFAILDEAAALNEAKNLCEIYGYSIGLEYIQHNQAGKGLNSTMNLLDEKHNSLWFCVKNVDLVWEGS